MPLLKIVAIASGLIIKDAQSIKIYGHSSEQLNSIVVTGATRQWDPYPILPGIPVLTPPGSPPPSCDGCEWTMTVSPAVCTQNTIFLGCTGGIRIEATRLQCVDTPDDCTNCTTPPPYIINSCRWGCRDVESASWAGPADVNCDGDLGTDADIEAFWSCLAGSCCSTCSADFDGDGDAATDADIQAFYRVLGGH